jgi:hypothetical protein
VSAECHNDDGPPSMKRKRKNAKPIGGGGTGNARSLANLKRGGQTTRPDLAVKHGAYARVAAEALDEKTRTIYDALAADAPLRADDGGLPSHDAVQVRLLADVLCRLDSVGAWLAGRWASDEGRPVLEVESKLRREAADYLDALGMTPRSRARLGIDVRRAQGFDLARVWADEDAIEGSVVDGD